MIKMINCQKCNRKTQHEKSKVNHILHLILSILTGGFWIPVWVMLWVCSYWGGGICIHCGKRNVW